MPHGRATMPAERRRPSSAGAARPICSSERRAPVSRSRTSREQPWQYSSTCFDVPIRWSQQQPSSRPVARRHQTRSSVASWNANPGSFPAATRPQTHHRRGAPRSRPVRDRPLLDESQCRPFAGRALRPPSQVWRFGATIAVVCPSSLFSCQGAAWVARGFPRLLPDFPQVSAAGCALLYRAVRMAPSYPGFGNRRRRRVATMCRLLGCLNAMGRSPPAIRAVRR